MKNLNQEFYDKISSDSVFAEKIGKSLVAALGLEPDEEKSRHLHRTVFSTAYGTKSHIGIARLIADELMF
jgi:hypothetical protein